VLIQKQHVTPAPLQQPTIPSLQFKTDDDVIVGGSTSNKTMKFRQKSSERWLKVRVWHSRCPVELAIDNAELQWEGNVDPVKLNPLTPVTPDKAEVVNSIQANAEAI